LAKVRPGESRLGCCEARSELMRCDAAQMPLKPELGGFGE
jgi:hypothetical protein